MEPWVSVELDGAWISRFAVNPGTSRMCIFRGAAPGRAKHVRLLKDVQAMSEDPAHPLHTGPLLYPGVWPGSGGAQRRAGGAQQPYDFAAAHRAAANCLAEFLRSVL